MQGLEGVGDNGIVKASAKYQEKVDESFEHREDDRQHGCLLSVSCDQPSSGISRLSFQPKGSPGANKIEYGPTTNAPADAHLDR